MYNEARNNSSLLQPKGFDWYLSALRLKIILGSLGRKGRAASPSIIADNFQSSTGARGRAQ
eukprot:1745094-Pleurochrysis_carterae.AAC.1